MTEKTTSASTRYLVLLLWIALGFFYTCLAYNYIVVSNKDKKLSEYLDYVVVVCGDDHRPAKEIRSLIMNRAEQLEVKLQPDQVAISGNGQTLKIGVSYVADIDMPLSHRSIYRKVFQHETSYRNIR
jgi:hypothetical protein